MISNNPRQEPLAQPLKYGLEQALYVAQLLISSWYTQAVPLNTCFSSQMQNSLLFFKAGIPTHFVALVHGMLYLRHFIFKNPYCVAVLLPAHCSYKITPSNCKSCSPWFSIFVFCLGVCRHIWKWACQAEKLPVIHAFIFSVSDFCTLSLWKFPPILLFDFLINNL